MGTSVKLLNAVQEKEAESGHHQGEGGQLVMKNIQARFLFIFQIMKSMITYSQERLENIEQNYI